MGRLAKLLADARTSADALVSAWQAVPHPALADAIDALPRPTVSIHGARQSTTIANVADGMLADGDRFLAALAAFPVGPLAAGAIQLERLARRAPDPRIGTRLHALLDDPPYRTRASLSWWIELLDLIVALGDARSRERLEHAIAKMHQAFNEPMRTLVRRAAEAAADRLPDLPPGIDDADAAAIDAVATRGAADDRSVVDLEAAVYGAPDERDLRLVYGDACTRAGDPRGELIALQARPTSTAKQRARIKQLIETGRSQWLGPLDRVLLKSSIRFDLGFLSEGTLKPKHEAHLMPTWGDPRWSTVRRLTLADLTSASQDAYATQSTVEALVVSDTFIRLTALLGRVTAPLAISLADGAPRDLTELEVHDTHSAHSARLRATFAEAPGLPRLRSLTWRDWRELEPDAPILSSATARRLNTLGVVAYPRDLMRWLGHMEAAALAVLRLIDFHDHREVRFERTATGLRLAARFRWPGMEIGGVLDPLMMLCEAALACPPGLFEAVTLRWTRKWGPRAEQRAAIEQMLGHLKPKKISLSK